MNWKLILAVFILVASLIYLAIGDAQRGGIGIVITWLLIISSDIDEIKELLKNG